MGKSNPRRAMRVPVLPDASSFRSRTRSLAHDRQKAQVEHPAQQLGSATPALYHARHASRMASLRCKTLRHRRGHALRTELEPGLPSPSSAGPPCRRSEQSHRGGYPDDEGFSLVREGLSDDGGGTMTTDHVAQPWALRSTLVAVADLNRSIEFYGELGPFGVVAREDAIAVLGDPSPGSLTLVLRETRGLHQVRHGQQSLGLRSMTFNVGSPAELDRIESFLRSRDLFTDRRQIADGASDLCAGAIRTTCPSPSSPMQKTRSDPSTTNRLSACSIRWTPDHNHGRRARALPGVTTPHATAREPDIGRIPF